MGKLHRYLHVATRAVLCAASVALATGGLLYYVQSTGGFADPSRPQIVWLNTDNSQAVDELKIQQDSQGNVTANPDKPVLLVECPREACEAKDLDLAGVTKALDGKVIVIALDPYADKKFAHAFEKLFITDQVMQHEETQAAENLLSSQGQTPTSDMVASLLAQKQLKDAVDLQAKNTVLMKPAYPKFYLFNAQDFSLVFAGSGISTRSDLLAIVNEALSAESNAGSASDLAATTAPDGSATSPAPSLSPTASATSAASSASALSGSTASVSGAVAPVSPNSAATSQVTAAPATTNNTTLPTSHSAVSDPSTAVLSSAAAAPQSAEKTIEGKE